MIKVNLLDSVTDRARGAAVIETQVANPRARSWMLVVAIGALTVLGMGFDWLSANSAHSNAQAELERQQQIATQMAAVNKEQAELEKKVKDIETRIDAIKKLRASQQGPVAVLSAINERIPKVTEFRLETIEQKAGELTIEGHSPNEAAITQFGRSLEFSSGLFSNVHIETERKELQVDSKDYADGLGQIDPSAPKPQTFKFKVKCKYTPPGAAASQPSGKPAAGAPATQIAQK